MLPWISSLWARTIRNCGQIPIHITACHGSFSLNPIHRPALTLVTTGVQAVDGGKGGGEQILSVFERRLTDNIEKLNFRNMLSPVNVKRIVEEADGYQPHLIAPEMGYRRLLTECLVLFKVCQQVLGLGAWIWATARSALVLFTSDVYFGAA